MKFEKHAPSERLKPHIRYFAVSETDAEGEYKVLPSSGLVIGFQYRGQLSIVKNGGEDKLARSGITGMSDNYKIFKNSNNIGTILVYFTETGFARFASHPAHELFNSSVSLDQVFDKAGIYEVEEKLAAASSDHQRVKIVEQFLLRHLNDIQTDKLVVEAIKVIYESKGAIQIKELTKRLYISPSSFEKQFRKIVGTTPKKFASIVRINTVIANLSKTKSLSDICYENNFFDQSHFIKNFKQFTGQSPERFKSSL